jgi:chemotaxis protein methyltransferase CheR
MLAELNRSGVMTYKEYLQVLKEHSPYDFSEYSDNSIFRRIQKVMRDYHLSLEELGLRTQSDKLFVEQVVEAITVNTTELFRDPLVWRFLFEKHLPAFRSNKFINIWHAGCSTGQEVYSLIILFNELGMLDKAQIFASDISQKAIDMAAKGVFKHQLARGCINNFNKVFENHSNGPVDFFKYFEVDEKNDKITVKPLLK